MKIVTADQALEIRNLLTVIYGDPNLGKTSLSFTMPTPILHMNFDRGIGRAYQAIRPNYADPTDFKAWYEYLMSTKFEDLVKKEGYHSVVLDTLGSMLDDYMAPYLISQDSKNARGGSLSLNGYGELKSMFNLIINRLQNLGLEVCAIAHAKFEDDGDGKKATMAVTGSSVDAIYRKADLIGYLNAKGERRMLNFKVSQFYQSKNTAKVDNIELPHCETTEYRTLLAEIIQKAKDEMTSESEAQLKIQETIKEYLEGLDECEELKDFEAWAAQLKEEPEKAVKLNLQVPFKTALKAAGLQSIKGTISEIPVPEKAEQHEETS